MGRKERFDKFFRLLLMMSVFLLVQGVASANAWWNEQWQSRKKVTFDTTAAGADIQGTLSDVPVLLRLHSGNLDFTRVKENGEDLRFVDADDKTLLKHHIERFDALDEIGLVWVKLPRLAAASNQGFIFMYHGNEEAVDAQDTAGVHDAVQAVVYHLSEIEGAPQDATAYKNHAVRSSAGLGLPGVIGTGGFFSGAGEGIVVPDSPSLDFTSGFTFSTWLRIAQHQADAHLFSRQDENGELRITLNDTVACLEIIDREGVTFTAGKCADLSQGAWHHLAVTAASRDSLALYLDGVEAGKVKFPKELPAVKGDLVIGASRDGSHAFAGDLDEIRVANGARTGDWIRAAYMSQGPDGTFTAFGLEEITESGGLPVFYLATIFKNITLDGLVVISLLVLMGIASWIVIISKGFFLMFAGKDNRHFLNAYERTGDPLSLAGAADGEKFGGSPLYRIYRSGCDTLKRWADGQNPEGGDAIPGDSIPKVALEMFKTDLEKGLILESKKLNAWLIILIMSISGGPFLGLLGTVWGVMNTFAAMAEAGEANIMAIAPGVASALSTTVFGLLVAIPALFGYNFIGGRIKDITADLGIFVDGFALKVEDKYGESS